MPFIDSKLTVKLSEEKKEALKTKLGKAISLMHKGESYLMVGIQDGYDLWFGGKRLQKGAFVSVSVLGAVAADDSQKMTAEICRILKDELDIPGDAVYVKYAGYKDWGWNGGNF